MDVSGNRMLMRRAAKVSGQFIDRWPEGPSIFVRPSSLQ
jgi:hypothetical protein